MLQGVCIDTRLSALLQEGQTYYLREYGKDNYYVGNFNNPKSYFGVFSKTRFELIDKQREEPLESALKSTKDTETTENQVVVEPEIERTDTGSDQLDLFDFVSN